MAKTNPAGRTHPGERGHLNVTETTEITEVTNNPQGPTPLGEMIPPGRPVIEVTERLSTL